MDRRTRVRNALSFRKTDQIPKDLGGMRSTGISCFAYGDLIRTLGLPPRKPQVYDTHQMLAMPEKDVLDRLDCDVMLLEMNGTTNAFPQPEQWKEYDFNGRLEALVRSPGDFRSEPDGSIIQHLLMANKIKKMTMPREACVFSEEHGGNPVDFSSDVFRLDTAELKKDLETTLLTDEQIRETVGLCRTARASTDRAILFSGLKAGLGFPGGMASWSMTCLLDPDHVHEVHDLVVSYALKNMGRLLPEIEKYIDIVLLDSNDQGTQNATIISPDTFRELYKPYYTRVNRALQESTPEVFRFLHSCGAIFDIIDDLIDAGFQVLNPVQWTAGGRSYKEWKDKCRNRLALWGGGVDTQSLFPLGSVEDIVRQARDVATYLSGDGGFVFTPIHNILAEIPGEKVAALYDAVP